MAGMNGNNPILLVTTGLVTTNQTPPMFTGQNDAKPTKSPLFEVPACFCREVISDPQFYNISISFKCKDHGDVTIDRRPLVAAPPLQLNPNWSPNLQPKYPGGQTWGGGFNGQGVNTVGDFAAMEAKAISSLTGKPEYSAFDSKGNPAYIEYDPVTGGPGDPLPF